MKSIKLASGFAVSALALAIAGQATAQTANLTFSGDLKVQTIIDLENNQYRNAQPGLISASEDWYNLDARWAFSNGPFSGRLRVGTFGGSATGAVGRGGEALVTVDSLLVTEGPVQFGQVGRVTATASLYERLTKENDLFQVENSSGNALGDESTRFNVDLGLRYTLSDLGLSLQLEAPRDREGVFGIAGALHQNLDVAQVWVDGQYRVNTNGSGENLNDLGSGMESDGIYNVGVALQVAPVDQLTLTGVYRLVTDDAGVDPRAVYAVKLDVQATDDVSLFALVTDRNANNQGTTGAANDSTVVRAGLTASVAPFVVEAGYEANYAELFEGFIFTKATLTDGTLSAFVGFDYSFEGFGFDSKVATDGGFKLSTGGSLTSASGIVYGAEYTFTDSDFWSATAQGSEIELFASYSF